MSDTNTCRSDEYEDFDSSQEMHEDSYVALKTLIDAPTPHASEETGGERYTPTQPIGGDRYTCTYSTDR